MFRLCLLCNLSFISPRFGIFFSYLLQLLFHTSSSSFLASIIESSAGNSLLLFMPSNKHQQHNDAEKNTAMDSVTLRLSSGELLSVLDVATYIRWAR